MAKNQDELHELQLRHLEAVPSVTPDEETPELAKVIPIQSAASAEAVGTQEAPAAIPDPAAEGAPAPEAVRAPVNPTKKSRRGLIIGGVASVVAVGVGGGVLATQGGGDATPDAPAAAESNPNQPIPAPLEGSPESVVVDVVVPPAEHTPVTEAVLTPEDGTTEGFGNINLVNMNPDREVIATVTRANGDSIPIYEMPDASDPNAIGVAFLERLSAFLASDGNPQAFAGLSDDTSSFVDGYSSLLGILNEARQATGVLDGNLHENMAISIHDTADSPVEFVPAPNPNVIVAQGGPILLHPSLANRLGAEAGVYPHAISLDNLELTVTDNGAGEPVTLPGTISSTSAIAYPQS